MQFFLLALKQGSIDPDFTALIDGYYFENWPLKIYNNLAPAKDGKIF